MVPSVGGSLAEGQAVEVGVLLLLERGGDVVELVDLFEVLLLLAVRLLDLFFDGEEGLLVALGQLVDGVLDAEATKRGESCARLLLVWLVSPIVGIGNATLLGRTPALTAADPREVTPNPDTTRGRVAKATRLRFPVIFFV